MYNPTFRTKPNGVPILSKSEIDIIAERCLMEFCPEVLKAPQPIDEDRFLTEYLGLTQDFQYLTHCGLYLGMIVFEDSNKIPVYDEEANRAEYIRVKKGTVIIDNTYLNTRDLQNIRINYENGDTTFDDLVRIFSYLGCEPEKFGYEENSDISDEAAEFMKALGI